MTSDLNDKAAIVTGAGRGPGREYAVKLAAAGAMVVAGDVLDCAETVATIEAAGDRAVAVTLDVRDQASCNAMAVRAMVEFGRNDVLVNNVALYGSLKGGASTHCPRTIGTIAWTSRSTASGAAVRPWSAK